MNLTRVISCHATAKSLLLILALLSGALAADEQNINPGINKQYKDAQFSAWEKRFERPGRDIYDHRYAIVAATGLRQGMVVADIGAGSGLFTRLFAEAVGPAGKVYAIDVTKNFVDAIMQRARASGLVNIEGIVNSQKDVGLSPASIDLAFVCATYHHFEYPRTTLNAIHRALRDGGTLVVIDYRKIPGVSNKWVMGHTRTDKAAVIGEIEAAGFQLDEDREFLRANYFLRFSKTAMKQ